MMRLLFCMVLMLLHSPVSFAGTNGGDYSAAYPHGARSAVEFYRKSHDTLKKSIPGVNEEMLKVIYSVVAPEVSQYDRLKDFVEVKALEVKYVKDGSCDYSVGRFQMKPSFVESLEKEVFNNAALKKKYGKYFKYATGKDTVAVRRERVKRMCDTEWQMRYLSVFIDVAKRRTAKWGLKSNAEKVRCWATLYNAGPYLSRQRVKQRQTVKQFPGGTKEFNYSTVAVELYMILKD